MSHIVRNRGEKTEIVILLLHKAVVYLLLNTVRSFNIEKILTEIENGAVKLTKV